MSYDSHLQHKTPWQVWCIAAFRAIALHVGCVALAVEYMRDDAEQASGAIAIEIGVELAAPRLSPTDLPPGPEADASTRRSWRKSPMDPLIRQRSPCCNAQIRFHLPLLSLPTTD